MAKPRVIAHFDADAFFASVEAAMNPRLRGAKIAVGGLRRGIIASASYAARACGVRTPMPTARALQICPDLILVHGHSEAYAEFSEKMFGFAEDITPYVERTSIDEGYLDLTPCRGDPVALMRGFVARIESALKITVSVGVAPNKLLAQIASKNKKPRGFTVVSEDDARAFLAPMDAGVLPAVGPKTAAALNARGFAKVGDIARLTQAEFVRIFGEGMRGVYIAALGIDNDPIRTEHAPAKSVSEQTTFPEDVRDFDTVARALKAMLDRLLTTVRAQGVRARTLTLRLRYPDWNERQCARSLEAPSDLESDFYPMVEPLLREVWTRKMPLRLVGAKLSTFSEGAEQGELFGRSAARLRALARASDALNRDAETPVLTRATHLGAPKKRPRSV